MSKITVPIDRKSFDVLKRISEEKKKPVDEIGLEEFAREVAKELVNTAPSERGKVLGARGYPEELVVAIKKACVNIEAERWQREKEAAASKERQEQEERERARSQRLPEPRTLRDFMRIRGWGK